MLNNILLYSQIILFIVFIFSIIINFWFLKEFIKNTFLKKDFIFIFFLVLINLSLQIYFFDPIPYNTDEYMYVETAKEISQNSYINWLNRVLWWPFLLFLVFTIFWFKIIVWNILAIIITCLITIFLYFLIKIISQNKIISLFSVLFFIISPMFVFWWSRLETNLPALFFIILSLFSIFYLDYDKNNYKKIFFVFSVITFSATFRIENIILFWILLLYFLLNFDTFKKYYKIIIFYFLLFWILFFPNFYSQKIFTESEDWTFWNKIIFSENFLFFIKTFLNIWFYKFYYFICLFWFFWVIYNFFKEDKIIKIDYKKFFLFILLFIILIIIYNNIWLKIIQYSRLYMEIFPLFSILFWFWIYFLYFSIQKYFLKLKNILLIILFFIVCLNLLNKDTYIFNWNYRHEKFILENQYELSNNFSKKYDEKCIYLIYYPFFYYWFVDNFKFVYNFEFINNFEFRTSILSNFDCIIFIKDRFCYWNLEYNTFYWIDRKNTKEYCEYIENNFNLEKIENWDYNFWLFKLKNF